MSKKRIKDISSIRGSRFQALLNDTPNDDSLIPNAYNDTNAYIDNTQ